jgi:hypothetical protein
MQLPVYQETVILGSHLSTGLLKFQREIGEDLQSCALDAKKLENAIYKLAQCKPSLLLRDRPNR